MINPKKYSDFELLKLIQNGVPFAFEEIYHRYANRVFQLVRKNIYSKEDSEEIMQEVFESICKRRLELGLILDFKSYILRTAKYKVIRYIQRKGVKRRYEDHYRAFELVYDSIPEDQRTPEQIIEEMLKHISGLPERCQQAVRLRIRDHLSNKEIAQIMNVNKRTVEYYMGLALRHFRSLYNQLYKLS